MFYVFCNKIEFRMNRDKYITPLSTRYVSPEMNANFGDNKKVTVATF